jgi:hypothetical protein
MKAKNPFTLLLQMFLLTLLLIFVANKATTTVANKKSRVQVRIIHAVVNTQPPIHYATH